MKRGRLVRLSTRCTNARSSYPPRGSGWKQRECHRSYGSSWSRPRSVFSPTTLQALHSCSSSLRRINPSVGRIICSSPERFAQSDGADNPGPRRTVSIRVGAPTVLRTTGVVILAAHGHHLPFAVLLSLIPPTSGRRPHPLHPKAPQQHSVASLLQAAYLIGRQP